MDENTAFSEEINQNFREAAPPLLEFRDVYKRFGSKQILKNFNLRLDSGGIIGLLGPNGSGKTTIIKLICGLLTPSSGEVLICGRNPSPQTASIISYLPDRNCLPPNMKVKALIDMYADFYRDFDKNKAYDMSNRLQIDKSSRLAALSKGNQEKLRLVLVMSRAAKLYVLDEPIGGIDSVSRDFMLDTIVSNYSDGASILISTHLISEVERILDDVIFLSEGRVAMCASVSAIHEKYAKSIDELFREVYR